MHKTGFRKSTLSCDWCTQSERLFVSFVTAILACFTRWYHTSHLVLTTMKHTPDSSQDLFSLQLCSFTQVKDASHEWINYQTTDHWNLVPHTCHLGSNSSTGRENMLAPTTRKYSQFWDSSNTIFKPWLGLISEKNCPRYLCQIHQIPPGCA